jgi:hypothetical protein
MASPAEAPERSMGAERREPITGAGGTIEPAMLRLIARSRAVDAREEVAVGAGVLVSDLGFAYLEC